MVLHHVCTAIDFNLGSISLVYVLFDLFLFYIFIIIYLFLTFSIYLYFFLSVCCGVSTECPLWGSIKDDLSESENEHQE